MRISLCGLWLAVCGLACCGAWAYADEYEAYDVTEQADDMQKAPGKDGKEAPKPPKMLDDSGKAWDGCCDNACCCSPRYGGEAFFGANAFKNPLDDTRGNNFGFLGTVNAGMLVTDNIGVQVGGSFGGYDFHGRADNNNPVEVEKQWFVTAGVFKRSTVQCGDHWSWGVVYDYFDAEAFGEDGRHGPDLHQIRAQFGYAIDCCNEIGFWGNWGVEDGSIIDSDNPNALVKILDQYNVYWKRHWCCGADTMAYIGIPDGQPGELVFGFNGVVPLDCNFALVGGWHYVLPSSRGGTFVPGSDFAPAARDEIWNLYVGISFSPGGYGCCGDISGHKWMPLLPVANNGVMPMVADPRENF